MTSTVRSMASRSNERTMMELVVSFLGFFLFGIIVTSQLMSSKAYVQTERAGVGPPDDFVGVGVLVRH